MNNKSKHYCPEGLFIGILFLIPGLLGSCQHNKTIQTMIIESVNFRNNEQIPSTFTCDGSKISPALQWKDFPAATKSFVLIHDDPDAPMGTWVHWILFNIPVAVIRLNENFSYAGRPEKKILAGINDFRKLEYGGPCPPSGTHRYFYKIYALDSFLELKEGSTKSQVEQAMAGHILAKGELIGLYRRK